MKYALLLWRDRVISVDTVQDIHGAGRPIKLKVGGGQEFGQEDNWLHNVFWYLLERRNQQIPQVRS
jgi:hypothetical protein